MTEQTEFNPKTKCAEVPWLGTGEDTFLRKVAEGSSACSLKPKVKLKEVDIEVSEGCPVLRYI